MIRAVFASGQKGEFGKGNTMPWPRNSEDLKNFRKYTQNTFTVMGRSTAKTIPLPLPYRVPIIVSKEPYNDFITIDYTKHSVIDYLQVTIDQNLGAQYSIIGGTKLLTIDTLKRCNEIYYTQFKSEFPDADVFLDKKVLQWLNNQEKETLQETEDFILYRIVNEAV